MAWLCYGALNCQISDWDLGVSILIGGLTYPCAPWTSYVIAARARARPKYRPLWLVAALFVAWGVVDGSCVAYHTAMGNHMLRAENFRAPSALCFPAGMLWFFRGSLVDLARDPDRALLRAPKSPAKND